jgi:hypothetical protein
MKVCDAEGGGVGGERGESRMPSVSASVPTPVKRNCAPEYGRSLLAYDQQSAR